MVSLHYLWSVKVVDWWIKVSYQGLSMTHLISSIWVVNNRINKHTRRLINRSLKKQVYRGCNHKGNLTQIMMIIFSHHLLQVLEMKIFKMKCKSRILGVFQKILVEQAEITSHSEEWIHENRTLCLMAYKEATALKIQIASFIIFLVTKKFLIKLLKQVSRIR